jgi:hypothetical protein
MDKDQPQQGQKEQQGRQQLQGCQLSPMSIFCWCQRHQPQMMIVNIFVDTGKQFCAGSVDTGKELFAQLTAQLSL